MGAEVVHCYPDADARPAGYHRQSGRRQGGDGRPAIVRHDGDDPYLVVAADKGTATFSDIANAVSRDYGFWLDDAFASGGSAGYDHKKMGITARGAWENVKRHFRETGVDIQTQDFTCIGVGRHVGRRLRQRHAALPAYQDGGGVQTTCISSSNPNPDPAKSMAERQRLFDLPRSAWSDYNAALISQGGGIYERRAKSIKLSKEVQRPVQARQGAGDAERADQGDPDV